MSMRLPSWLKTNSFSGLHKTKSILRNHRLMTVCEEARCPNKGYCFSKPTATFMILGNTCTRNCSFCSIQPGQPLPPDPREPERVAQAAAEMGLKYVVITSVTRDDLPDGGANHFARSIHALRNKLSDVTVEVLTPDFMGKVQSLITVVRASPDVFNHNVETVPRLYDKVRPLADYERSLYVLRKTTELSSAIRTKSGIMVGLGERFEEVIDVMKDLRNAGCQILTIGQYLRPNKENIDVMEYVHPGVFDMYAEEAQKRGFQFVASAPLVRSSMNAEAQFLHSP